MAKSRALARYLFRLRHQKRYSFTKTKMAIGFVVSLFTSIYFGTYFEEHGLEVVRQAYHAVTTKSFQDPADDSSTTLDPQPP